MKDFSIDHVKVFFFDEGYINPNYPSNNSSPDYRKDYNKLGKAMTEEEKTNTLADLNKVVTDATAKINDANTSDVEKNRLKEYIKKLAEQIKKLS